MHSQLVIAQVPGPDPKQPRIKYHTILVVLTHADDYLSIAPLLARYAAGRHNVHYAIFNGEPDSVMLQPGGKKHAELLCAAKILGLKEPIIFTGSASVNVSGQNTIAQKTIRMISQIKPDVMITWAPDDLTAHPWHILIGEIVTRVFQQQYLLEHQLNKLYYIAYPQSRIAGKQTSFGEMDQDIENFGSVPDSFISTIIEGKNFLLQTREAIACHKLPNGKLNKEWQEKWYVRLSAVLDGKVFLRRAYPYTNEKETDIFHGLQ